jgi:hypothetical protein
MKHKMKGQGTSLITTNMQVMILKRTSDKIELRKDDFNCLLKMVSSRSQGYARPPAGLAAQLQIQIKSSSDQFKFKWRCMDGCMDGATY